MSTHANQDFSCTEKIKWYGEQFSSLNIWGPLALFTKRHGVPLLSHYMPLGTMTMTPQWRCFACILMGQFFYGHQYLSNAFSPFIHFQVVCPSINFQQFKLQKYLDFRCFFWQLYHLISRKLMSRQWPKKGHKPELTGIWLEGLHQWDFLKYQMKSGKIHYL